MKRVLIVSPRFPPTSAPDHQRVRMMLPTLRDHGWAATVLAVKPADVEAPIEPALASGVEDIATVVRVPAVPFSLTRRLGFGSLALRSYASLATRGARLLKRGRFDVVFFSTTEFPVLPMAPQWKKRFGVPFVVDLQDPWLTDYFEGRDIVPPGGRIKHAFTQAIARRSEGDVMRSAARVISVSPAYVTTLTSRYPDISSGKFAVVPFGGSRLDFALADAAKVRQHVFDPTDGRRHWIYAGTAPPGIRHAVLPFFLALRRALDERLLRDDEIRVHFVGTDYAPAGAAIPRILPLAREAGVSQVVTEHPSRIPYFETLRCLRDAGALLVFGWDDPGYTASKIYPYILAEKPLLAVFHEGSTAVEVVRRTGAGQVATYDGRTDGNLAAAIYQQWFASGAFRRAATTNWDAFEPYSAEAMTRRVATVLHEAATIGP